MSFMGRSGLSTPRPAIGNQCVLDHIGDPIGQ